MSVIYSFMDDTVYGADDINKVFSKVTTQGVSLFKYTNGNNPLVSLNNAIKGFTEPGVEMYNINACKVSYNKGNDKFTIGVGNAFMVDGSSITIDSEAYDITGRVYELRKSSTSDILVCFYRNISNNSIDIVVDTANTYYNSEYSVQLAKISSDNTVIDTRKFAKTKLAPCSANVIQEKTINLGTLLYHDTGYKLRRVILKDIFPGASKVFLNGVVRDIQRVNVASGGSLVYERAWFQGVSSDVQIAFNMTSDGLEVWASQPYDSATPGDWNIMIF